MTAKPRRKPSATVGRNELLSDSRGRAVDDEYVEHAVEDAIDYVRGRGRPSLSLDGESPLLRVRVSRDLDVVMREVASASGQSLSEWVRAALEQAIGETLRPSPEPPVE
jgi:hypothetical protein